MVRGIHPISGNGRQGVKVMISEEDWLKLMMRSLLARLTWSVGFFHTKSTFVQYRYPLIDFIHEFRSTHLLMIARQGQRSGKAVQAQSTIKVSQLQT